MPETPQTTSKYGRRIRWLGVFVVVLIALYSAGWFYLANLIETRATAAIQALNATGVTAECVNPTARGYPFRIGLYCDRVAFDDPSDGVSVSAGSFRSAGQIYDPMRLVAELDGPATIAAPGTQPLALDWSGLRASVRLAQPLPERVSIEGSGLAVAAADGRKLVSSESFEGHMRPNEADMDLAARFGGLALDPGLLSGRAMPALSGEADLTVKDGVNLVVNGAKSLRGQSAVIRTLALTLGDAGAVSLTGPISVDANGLVDADLMLGLRDPTALAATLVAALPEKKSEIEQIFSGLAMLGNQPSLPLKIRGGRASLGFIPLGDIPPLE